MGEFWFCCVCVFVLVLCCCYVFAGEYWQMGCMDGGMISVRVTLLIKHFFGKISWEEKIVKNDE